INKYNKLLDEILEDYKNDYILKDDFDRYNMEYLYELNRLRLEKDKLNINKKNDIDLKWLKNIKANGKIKELNRNVLSSFIDKIYVNDKGTVEIILKYASQYENAIKALKYD
ncbi:MAG: hypothetical protein Q4E69_04005, partial [Bacilli bacterium]|nr:hypothetical protein [Bacilli bacterium]